MSFPCYQTFGEGTPDTLNVMTFELQPGFTVPLYSKTCDEGTSVGISKLHFL